MSVNTKKCIIYLSILGDENRTQIGKEEGFHLYLVIGLTENKSSEEKLFMNPSDHCDIGHRYQY